jgi:prepilin-type N-terminal cleavage/methylation domain-containing protein
MQKNDENAARAKPPGRPTRPTDDADMTNPRPPRTNAGDHRAYARRTRRAGRRGLTLLELIVVLAILVALSGLVIPLIQGLGYQTNASINAAVVGDVNRSVGTYVTRFDKYPNEWDSLLNSSDALFSKLYPSLRAASPQILQPAALTGLQAQSLTDMGIHQLHDHDESAAVAPNTTGTGMRPPQPPPESTLPPVSLSAGTIVVMLNKTSLNTSGTLAGDLFSARELSETSAANDYVVVGLGTATTIRGTVMTEVPMLHGSDPSRYYSRVLCVFMVPGTGSTATAFPAKYVGCFLPDGSSLRSNLERYHNTGLD